MSIQLRSSSTVELVQANASDDLVARAAWVSNFGGDARLKDTAKIEGLINFLWRERHTSPFEHGQFTFYIETPIFVAREFMRHRTQSFNEWSARYSELEPVFYMPREDRPIVQTGKIGTYKHIEGTGLQKLAVASSHADAYTTAWTNYQHLLSMGVAREVARNVLPVGTYTKFFASVNPLNLMKFLDLRTSDQALDEMRSVVQEMEAHFKICMPLTYEAWKK